MVMPSNNIGSYSTFYLRVDMCYGTHCRTAEVPWTKDFAVLPKRADIAVLDDPAGKWKPGLYVRYDTLQWRLAMDYEDVCNLLVNASAIKVVVQATETETLGLGFILFRNAQRRESTVITPSPFNVYVGVLLESEAVDISKLVAKEDSASTEGILQISDGSRAVEDWVPGTAGLVKVDAAGKAEVAIKGVDYEVHATTTEAGVVKIVTEADAPSTSDTEAATPAYVGKIVADTVEDATVKAAAYPDEANDEGLTTPAYVDAAITDALTIVTVKADAYPDKENDEGLTTPAYVDTAITDALTIAIEANTTFFKDSVTNAPVDAPAVDAAAPSLDLLVAGVRTNALALKTIRSLGGVALGYAVIGSTS